MFKATDNENTELVFWSIEVYEAWVKSSDKEVGERHKRLSELQQIGRELRRQRGQALLSRNNALEEQSHISECSALSKKVRAMVKGKPKEEADKIRESMKTPRPTAEKVLWEERRIQRMNRYSEACSKCAELMKKIRQNLAFIAKQEKVLRKAREKSLFRNNVPHRELNELERSYMLLASDREFCEGKGRRIPVESKFPAPLDSRCMYLLKKGEEMWKEGALAYVRSVGL